MEVYKSKFLILNYFQSEEYIEMKWLAETVSMSDNDYKQVFQDYIKIIDKYRPKGVLPNTLDMKFTIEPELQEWTNENVFVFSLSIGLDKAAFVVSQDFISQLSIEQTMEEQEGKKFLTRYFTNEEDARKWLVEEIKNSNLVESK